MALPQLNSARYQVYVPGLQKEVSFRPYLVKEEKILMMAMESNDQKQILTAVSDIIEACVFDDINVKKLAVFDVEYLFINLRQKSVGEGINVSMKCSDEDCSTENNVEVDLDKIDIPKINKEDNIIMLSDDVGITMRYPSFKDISQFKPEELDKIDGIMSLLKLCVVNIFDSDNVHETSDISKKELDDFIDGMNSEQFSKLGGFFQDMPSLKTNLEFNCIKCGKENITEVRGLQSFFT